MSAPYGHSGLNNLYNLGTLQKAGLCQVQTSVHSPLAVLNRNSKQRADQPRDPWQTVFGRDSKHTNVLRIANGDNLPYLDLWHMWTSSGNTNTDSDFLTESSGDEVAIVTTTPIVRVFGRIYDHPASAHRRQWPQDVDSDNFGFHATDLLNNNQVMFRPLKDTETDEVAIELPSSQAGDSNPALKYTVDGLEFYGGLPRFVYTAGMADVLVLVERAAVISNSGVGVIVGHFHG